MQICLLRLPCTSEISWQTTLQQQVTNYTLLTSEHDTHLPRKSSASKSLSNASNWISRSLLPLKTSWHEAKRVCSESCTGCENHTAHDPLSRKASYLIHFIPCWVEILLDNLTLKHNSSYVDLDIGVTLALHHASHQIVLGHQILGL